MQKFRWAYIGAGGIAQSTAKSILRGNHEIRAVYSRTYEKAQSFARRVGAKAYESLEELLQAGDFDGVYIATPHTSHVQYALAALRAHYPVLCEKPCGICAADIKLLTDTARENDTYFAEAMWTWFSDTAIQVRSWVQQGKLGKIRSVRLRHSFPGMRLSETSRVRDPMTAGGALLDVGIYPITYCYNLFGYPDKILCEGTVEGGIDTRERIVLSYGDMECEIHTDLYSLRETCCIRGENSTVRVPFVYHAAPIAIRSRVIPVALAKGHTTYLNEFDRCVQEIRQGKKESAYVPFRATLDCMRIMDECRRQLGLVYPFESSKQQGQSL